MEKFWKHKSKFAAIALVLTLIVTVACAVLPIASAATTMPGYTPVPDRDTGTAVGVSPTLIGLGQRVLINILTFPAPADPYQYGSHDIHYKQIECTITSPDGSQTTFMPVDNTLEAAGIIEPGRAQTAGTLQFYYTPSQTGEYTVSATCPGQFFTTDITYPSAKMSVYYNPSTSPPTKFTVQEEEVQAGLLTGYPWSPLPENYWENPVSTNNREWAVISGAWPQWGYNWQKSNYNPYSTAPKSPHIVWKRQIDSGGLAGGIWGSLSYTQASGGGGSVILDGKIYQNLPSGEFECVDLRTGEQLWTAKGNIGGSYRTMAQFQTERQIHQGGVSEWLWGGLPSVWGWGGSDTWTKYSTFNGRVIGTITNVPLDLEMVRYNDGDNIFWCTQSTMATYNTTNPMNREYLYLIKWDISKLSIAGETLLTGIYSSDWRDGIVWNVTCLYPEYGPMLGSEGPFTSVNIYPYEAAGVVVLQGRHMEQIAEGFDMNTGNLLWVNNNTVIHLLADDHGVSASPSGPLINFDGATAQWVAYNVKTGKEQWAASAGELPWSKIPPNQIYLYNNGVVYFGSYDGHVYAYNSETGDLVWKSDYVGEEWESIYGNQPFNGAAIGADGVLYFATTTVYQLQPRTRFHALYAIDEDTGHFLWKLPIGVGAQYGPSLSVAYGYLTATDIENGMQYCIGKGQTTTTITAQPAVATAGNGVLIQGSVLDMSPGQPNTPAVSDENMSEWMDYLHGQNATLINNPPTPTGVPVSLDTLDPNGNFVHIGDVTSDGSGMFKELWTPEIPGEYTVWATFAGSDSYWSSYATTAIGIMEAPPAPPEPTEPAVQEDIDRAVESLNPMFIGIIVAVAVAIVIGLVNLWMLRKRQ